MITLSLAPAVLTGKKNNGWNKINKTIACVWLLLIDLVIIGAAVL